MVIAYSIFIGIISSKIARKIDGIVLQCRRDKLFEHYLAHGSILVSDPSIRGSPNYDRTALRRLTPEHNAAMKSSSITGIRRSPSEKYA
jgi:hypothetical protein